MGNKGWEVVVLSNIPEVVDMLTTTLARLGHEPVATIAANSKNSSPEGSLLHEGATVSGVESILAPDKGSLEPILQSFKPDFVFSWGFPWRVPDDALEVAKFGTINYHPSLLPRHRGPLPVAWTIRMGDDYYGVTWHRMASAYDSGPILAQRSTPTSVEDTSSDVTPLLSGIGLRMLGGVIDRAVAGDPGDPQPTEGMTEEGVFESAYATIDWSMSARAVHDQVRAWGFIPSTSSVTGPIGELNGRAVRVVHTTLHEPDDDAQRVECGDGPIWILKSELIG
jgi:methionyl-tRNA formyltransferase